MSIVFQCPFHLPSFIFYSLADSKEDKICKTMTLVTNSFLSTPGVLLPAAKKAGEIMREGET